MRMRTCRRSRLPASAALAAALLASGCAVLEPRDPADKVRERAEEFVAAVRAAEYTEAYELTTPAYRSVTTVTRFASEYAGAPRWTDAVVSEVACDEQRCKVRLMISYQMARPAISNTRPINQVWVLAGGEWYLYPDG